MQTADHFDAISALASAFMSVSNMVPPTRLIPPLCREASRDTRMLYYSASSLICPASLLVDDLAEQTLRVSGHVGGATCQL